MPLNSPVDGDNACIISNESPVIFLWGWYRSSEVLNRYTSEDSCRDRTFWFAPNPGADNVMLTSDDFTAAFYMDFNKSDSGVLTASKCGGVSDTHYARWCLVATTTSTPPLRGWWSVGPTSRARCPSATAAGADPRRRATATRFRSRSPMPRRSRGTSSATGRTPGTRSPSMPSSPPTSPARSTSCGGSSRVRRSMTDRFAWRISLPR
ncbi:MAG: hypothetical protein M5U19_04330 [Microthrixaceae bacterium]|nr:hypothetical protein [Microthrixaceae bacterium]